MIAYNSPSCIPSIKESSTPDPVVIFRQFPCVLKCSSADFISSLGCMIVKSDSPRLTKRHLFEIVYYMKIVNSWERTKVHHAQILLILLPSLLFRRVFLLSLVEERF